MPGTVMERYALAQQASEIVVDPNHRTSADYLIASGMAQAAGRRNSAAVALWRLKQKIGEADTETIRMWAVARAMREFGRAPHNLHPKAANNLFQTVLHWFLEGCCPRCQGRRFEFILGTQVISATPCHLCRGAGREPVTNRLHKRHRDAGRWLADEFGNMLSYIERDMAARLRG